VIGVLLTSINDIPPSGWEDGILYQIWLNLIRHDRWQLILQGLGVALQIAFFSIIIGLILGFFTALMRTSKFKALRTVAMTYVTVIRGIPMLVQLMILYFAILGPYTNLPKILIAIIAFGINSGAYTSEIFRAGILSVDYGQTEAGRSLGFSTAQTMRLIILPQAVKNALPSLGNEFILLLKETSIAGFIGVQDLTKAGDIIRSRTFSAFTPLITVAIIYLILVMTLTWLLSKLERRLRKGDTR